MIRTTMLATALVGLLGLSTPVSASDDPTIAIGPVPQPECWVDAVALSTAGCTVEGFGAGCLLLDGSNASNGWIGVSCGVLGASCTQAYWGHHGTYVFAGGYNGCHAAVAVHRDVLQDKPDCTMTASWPTTLHCTGAGMEVACTPAAVGSSIVTECAFGGDACPQHLDFHTDGRPVTVAFMGCRARVVAENPIGYIAPLVNV